MQLKSVTAAMLCKDYMYHTHTSLHCAHLCRRTCLSCRHGCMLQACMHGSVDYLCISHTNACTSVVATLKRARFVQSCCLHDCLQICHVLQSDIALQRDAAMYDTKMVLKAQHSAIQVLHTSERFKQRFCTQYLCHGQQVTFFTFVR